MENIEGLENNGGAMIDTKELRRRAGMLARIDSGRTFAQDMLSAADELDALRARVAELENFAPTSEQINALPEKLRNYIHDIEIKCGDAASVVQENALARITIDALQQQLAEARELIKRHEAALEFLFKEPFARLMNKENFETFSLGMNERCAWVSFDGDDDEFYLQNTPLETIEAAKGGGE